MIWVLVGLQLLTLGAAVLGILQERRKTARIAEMVSDIMRQVTASRPASGIWRILRRDSNGKWNPTEWVREGSEAWQNAHDTPGMALRHGIEGEVVEGLQ